VKAPKIQRLITPATLQRKRHRNALKNKRVVKNREESAAYHKLVAQITKERQSERQARRRSSRSKSETDTKSK